jgi:DNA-directed RNA polymerase specialized sigma24 family protein
MARSTYPLFPTDDGWPYPDAPADEAGVGVVDDDLDLDALELQVDPRAFGDLSPVECDALTRRYGFDCDAESMKELARSLGCSHAEARDHLGRALDKVRARLVTLDP